MPARDDIAPRGPYPTVSVLLPNYNHGRFIGRMLQTLADQTRQPEEVIVVDDGSTDDSIDIIESFHSKIPQLKLFRNSTNVGLNGAINRALAEASCSHVVCGAADDWLETTFLEKMTAAAWRFPQARLCISQYVEFLEAENRILKYGPEMESGPWYAAAGETQFVSPAALCQFLDDRYVWLPASGALIHRDTFRALGGYDPQLRWHSDWLVTYTIALRHGFLVVPEPLSMFRVAAGTYSAGAYAPKLEREVCRAVFDKLRQPNMRDIYVLLREHPSAFTPFLRHLVLALVPRPQAWPFLSSLAVWWLIEVCKGRRPGVLRDLVQSWRGKVATGD